MRYGFLASAAAAALSIGMTTGFAQTGGGASHGASPPAAGGGRAHPGHPGGTPAGGAGQSAHGSSPGSSEPGHVGGAPAVGAGQNAQASSPGGGAGGSGTEPARPGGSPSAPGAGTAQHGTQPGAPSGQSGAGPQPGGAGAQSTPPNRGATTPQQGAAPGGTTPTPPATQGATNPGRGTPNAPNSQGANTPGGTTPGGNTASQPGNTSTPNAAPAPAGGGSATSGGSQPGTAPTGGSTTTTTSGQTGGNPNFTSLQPQQQTTVRETFFRQRVEPATNIGVSVSVGVALPGTVRLYPVPEEIVTISPAYRGYEYTVLQDQILIVEPGTRRIVEVISRSGGGTAASTGGGARGRLTLSTEKRTVVRRVVTSGRARPVTGIELREGEVLPQTVELTEFSPEIITEVPELREYEYVVVGPRLGIVERQSRTVADVIE